MNKRVATHLIVMVVSLILAGYIAQRINGAKSDFSKHNSAFSGSLAGFNKFASDIQWMLFVNYSGSVKTIDDSNSNIVYEKLKTIVNNDPGFDKAYEIGSMMLSVAAPDKALEILEKGCKNPQLNSNWKLPFYAGYILTHHAKNKESDDVLAKAEDYFREAVKRAAGSEKHVISQLIHAKAKRVKNRKNYKGIAIASDKHAYLLVLYDEWKSQQMARERDAMMPGPDGKMPAGSDAKAPAGAPTEVQPPMGPMGMGGMMSGYPDLEKNLLATAQAAKKLTPDNPDFLKTLELVKTEVFKNQHLCENCLATYGPGDKYCIACGTGVTIYGICPGCGAVPKGSYCQACGKNIIPPKIEATEEDSSKEPVKKEKDGGKEDKEAPPPSE